MNRDCQVTDNGDVYEIRTDGSISKIGTIHENPSNTNTDYSNGWLWFFFVVAVIAVIVFIGLYADANKRADDYEAQYRSANYQLENARDEIESLRGNYSRLEGNYASLQKDYTNLQERQASVVIEDEPYLYPSEDNLVFDYQGGSANAQTIYIESNCSWYISIDVAGWAHTEINGDYITIWCDYNGGSARSDWFKITSSDGSESYTINFTQN